MEKNTLVDRLFDVDHIPAKATKGRSNTLIAKRNMCLIARYYYYYTFSDRRPESILKQLKEEFYLSEDTLRAVLRTGEEQIALYTEAKVTRAILYSKWPHMKW